MNFLSFLKAPTKNHGTGALLDTRTEEAKLSDYHLGEIVASVNAVNWVEKSPAEWRKFPIFNQNGSGSCVAQTLAKLMGILYWLKTGEYVHFSATHIYQRRVNKPAGGMGGDDVWRIGREGATLEALVPSQNMTDAQMDSAKIEKFNEDVGKVFAIPKFVQLPTGDIDAIASVIQTTGKGVMIWTFWNYNEWTAYPKILDPNLTRFKAQGVHSTAGVDYALVNGKKHIINDESWGTGNALNGQRALDEEFIKERNIYAAYALNFVFDDKTENLPARPRYNFTRQLKFIAWDTAKNQPVDVPLNESQKADVIGLQNILKFEGMFPSNVASTGYYGAVTADGVLKFQRKYKIDNEENLAALKGRNIGVKTLAKLKELYGI